MEYFIGLGTNQGNRLEHLKQARQLIEERLGKIKRVSPIYETAAWGLEDQADFLNQVILISSILNPTDVLQSALNIEAEIGRIRLKKWGPRIIDIDILFAENQVLNLDQLTLPHPLIQERNFVLQPLVDLSPNFVHPTLNKTMFQLLKESPDKQEIILYSSTT